MVRATSGAEALGVLAEFALRDRAVALIASDQRMPEMTGVEFLDEARRHAPDAGLVLLTAYADTDVAIRAINDIGLDHYLLKPWDPPEDRLYPVIDDLPDDWRRAHPDGRSGLRVVGHRWSERSHEVKASRCGGGAEVIDFHEGDLIFREVDRPTTRGHERPESRSRCRRRSARHGLDAGKVGGVAGRCRTSLSLGLAP